MNPPRIYLESTIPSYLTARSSRDLVIRGQQEATRRWWEQCQDRYVCHVSAMVEVEILRGHPEAAARRMEAIAGIRRLRESQEVLELAARILATGIIPPKAEMDASHIAIAAVHDMDLLLTWNCTHIHNVFIHRRIVAVCESMDYSCPEICTPFDLLKS
jgi:hypothetical protein